MNGELQDQESNLRQGLTNTSIENNEVLKSKMFTISLAFVAGLAGLVSIPGLQNCESFFFLP